MSVVCTRTGPQWLHCTVMTAVQRDELAGSRLEQSVREQGVERVLVRVSARQLLLG